MHRKRKEALTALGEDELALEATTHSCRVTRLKLVGQVGLREEVSTRLSYHRGQKRSGSRSVRSYNRASLERPVEILENIVDSIAAALFLPQAPIGERWPKGFVDPKKTPSFVAPPTPTADEVAAPAENLMYF